MTTFPAHPAWDFVTHLYAAPSIAPACLGLQERHGIDVTFMLFCLWQGTANKTPLGAHTPALAAIAREWHEAVVLPVRSARRKLKTEAETSQRQEIKALYKTVVTTEIDCEHAELLMLAERADALCGLPEGKGTAAVMARNMAAFFKVSGVVLTAQDQPAIATILEAAGASAGATLITSPE